MNLMIIIGTVLSLVLLVAAFVMIAWVLFDLYDDDIIKAYYNRNALGSMFKLFIANVLILATVIIGAVTDFVIKQHHITIISENGFATLLTTTLSAGCLILAIMSVVFTVGSLRYRDYRNAAVFVLTTIMFIVAGYVSFVLH